MRHPAKFCQNRSKHDRDNDDFSIFQDGGRPPSWICCVSDWTTLEGRFGGLYHCAKFGWNRCSSFDNMHMFFDFTSWA